MPGNYDESLINDVIKNADIVSVISSYIPVTRKGRSYTALCPFHDDVNPSLMISQDKQIYKCFVCGAGGNAITFVQNYEKVPFMEAARKVASLSNFFDPRLEKVTAPKKVDSEKENIYKCLEDLTLYYSICLQSEEGDQALKYLEGRGLDEKIQNKYRLGYAMQDGAATCSFLQQKGHSIKSIDDSGIASMLNGTLVDKNRGRVIFPIEDEDGRVVGYSARSLKSGDDAKYINTSETQIFHKGDVLYNYHNAMSEAKLKGYVYLVEGFMDVFALDRVGISSAVALMGTALTKNQIALLRKLNVEVRVCLDGDNPGMDAALKISSALSKEGLKYRIVDAAGDTRDLDEILAADGADALINHVNNLYERIDFALNYYQRSNALKTSDDRRKLVVNFLPILNSIKDNFERDNYIYRLSKVVNFTTDSINDLLKDYRRQQRENENQVSSEILYKSYHPEQKYLHKLITTEKEVLYQMLNNKDAVKFYEDNIWGFYDNVYRSIAEYLVDYYKTHDDIDFNDIVNIIANSDIENKQDLINEMTGIYQEKDKPQCSEELLNDYLNTINEEKNKIYEKDSLSNSISGKDEIEKSRIYNDYHKGRIKKGEK